MLVGRMEYAGRHMKQEEQEGREHRVMSGARNILIRGFGKCSLKPNSLVVPPYHDSCMWQVAHLSFQDARRRHRSCVFRSQAQVCRAIGDSLSHLAQGLALLSSSCSYSPRSLSKLRKDPKAEILMGKNTMIKFVIRRYASSSGNSTFNRLADLVKLNCGLVFTDSDVKKVREILQENK
eukprot:747011-Hanusia_phi.AAC.1